MTSSKPHAESTENAEKDSAKICEVCVTESKPHAECAENAEKDSAKIYEVCVTESKVIVKSMYEYT